jgi:hypothetical protein
VTTEVPEYVYELGKVEPQDPLIRALNRLAQAIEQATLAKLDTTPGTPGLAPLPPVRLAESTALGTVCPVHNAPWKTVPAGVSKRTGKPYDSFMACPVDRCDQRPR